MSGNEHLYSEFMNTNAKHVPWKISDVIFSYIFIFAFSIFSVGAIILSGVNTDSVFFPALIQIAMSAVTVGIVYFTVSKKYKVPFAEAFGINKSAFPQHISVGIVVAILLMLSTTVVSFIFTTFFGAVRKDPYSEVSGDKLKVLSMMAVFTAPIVEEIFFRGFMQSALVKNFGVFFGVAITAVIFAISHAQYLDYGAILTAVTVIGFILGFAKQYTGSIVPGIIAHLINNFMAAVALFYT